MKHLLIAFLGLVVAMPSAQSAQPRHSPSAARSSESASSGDAIQELIDELEEMKGLTPTKSELAAVFSHWKELSNPHKGAIRDDVAFMTCAGLLAIGDMDSFARARSELSDERAFQTETTESCSNCHGTGRTGTPCDYCRGSGRCSRCHGNGSIDAPRLQGMGSAASMPCPSCHGSGSCIACNDGQKELRCASCNGSGRRVSKQRAQSAFERHRARAVRHLVAALQKARGLTMIGGKWMTPGSIRNISLSVLQKFPLRGVTMMREPMSGEHGGLLCVDSSGEVGCVIVSSDEWDRATEGRTYRFDLFRCGQYTYTTKTGLEKTVPLFATDLDTALEEMETGIHSDDFDP